MTTEVQALIREYQSVEPGVMVVQSGDALQPGDIEVPMVVVFDLDYRMETATQFAEGLRLYHGVPNLVLHVACQEYHLFHFVSDGNLDVGMVCRANGGDGTKTNARYIKRHRVLRLAK